MTNARATDRVQEPPITGIDPSIDEFLGELVVDANDLSTTSLDNCDVTIIGFGRDMGGEVKKNAAGEDFTTGPQIIMQLRVDDMDGIDNTKQYFPIRLKKDGTIAPPQVNSQYGQWLSVLAGYGVSGDDATATRIKFTGLRDLIGLQFHRQLQEFEGYRGRALIVAVPTDVYGYDNEVRTQLGLTELNLKDEAAA